jgi:hypothetical protein
VSIGAVVVSHNSVDDLPACLEALRFAVDLERVVVVDNDSGDESREVVEGFDDPRISLVVEEVNSGFAGGCNRGFRELSGDIEYLVFLNPDVVVSPDCFERSAESLASDSGLAGVAPLLMRSDGDTVDSVGQVLRRWTLEVADRGYERRGFGAKGSAGRVRSSGGVPVSGAGVGRGCVRTVGAALLLLLGRSRARVAAGQLGLAHRELPAGGGQPSPRRRSRGRPRPTAMAAAAGARSVRHFQPLDDPHPSPPSP